MIACEINKNSFKYRTLKDMSDISEYSLDSFISYIEMLRNQDLIFPAHQIDMSELDEDEVVDVALALVHKE